MEKPDLQNLAVETIRDQALAQGPADPKVVAVQDWTEWDPESLRTMAEHELTILEKEADLVVFFEPSGTVAGWRDDGRLGLSFPVDLDREGLEETLTEELNLAPGFRVGRITPALLPYVGWTVKTVIFLASLPRDDQVARAWLNPQNNKIIQFVRGSSVLSGEGPEADVPTEEESGQLKKAAAAAVKELLVNRLGQVGITPEEADDYFRLEPGEPEYFTGGHQVRVRTWRFWSEAATTLDGDTGQVLSWSIDRRAEPPTDYELALEQALALAPRLIDLPDEAELRVFFNKEYAEGRKVVFLDWSRLHQGMRVVDDYLSISFHPATYQLVEFHRSWRELGQLSPGQGVTVDQAENVVEARRDELEIGPEMTVSSIEKVIVKYKPEPELPGPVEDRVAWLVTLNGPLGLAEVQVDAETAAVLAVKQTL